MKNNGKLILLYAFCYIITTGFSCGKYVTCGTKNYVKKIDFKIPNNKKTYQLGDTIWFEGSFKSVTQPDVPLQSYDDYTSETLNFKNRFSDISIQPLQLLNPSPTSNFTDNAVSAGTEFKYYLTDTTDKSLALPMGVAGGNKIYLNPNLDSVYLKLGLIAQKKGTYSIFFNSVNLIESSIRPGCIDYVLLLKPGMYVSNRNSEIFKEIGFTENRQLSIPNGSIPTPQSDPRLYTFHVE